jgi:hypothetical protein
MASEEALCIHLPTVGNVSLALWSLSFRRWTWALTYLTCRAYIGEDLSACGQGSWTGRGEELNPNMHFSSFTTCISLLAFEDTNK